MTKYTQADDWRDAYVLYSMRVSPAGQCCILSGLRCESRRRGGGCP